MMRRFRRIVVYVVVSGLVVVWCVLSVVWVLSLLYTIDLAPSSWLTVGIGDGHILVLAFNPTMQIMKSGSLRPVPPGNIPVVVQTASRPFVLPAPRPATGRRPAMLALPNLPSSRCTISNTSAVRPFGMGPPELDVWGLYGLRAATPIWIPWLLCGCVLLAALLGVYVVDRRRRHREGCCRVCGYDLTLNVSGICPECGHAVPKEQRRAVRRGGWPVQGGARRL